MATPEELAARRREELRRLMLGKGTPAAKPAPPQPAQPTNLSLGEQAERERAKRLYEERVAAQRAAAAAERQGTQTPAQPGVEARRRAALDAKRRELEQAKRELARRQAEAARADAQKQAAAQARQQPAPAQEVVYEAPEPIAEPTSAKPAAKSDASSKANRIATLLRGKGARDVMLLREVLDRPLALRDE